MSIFKVMFHLDSISFKKNPPKSLKCVLHPPNLLESFRVYIKIFNKDFMQRLRHFLLQKPPKNHYMLFGSGLASIKIKFFCFLKYLLELVIKLLIKLFFSHLQIFLKFFSLWTIFCPKNHPKIITDVWKRFLLAKFVFDI